MKIALYNVTTTIKIGGIETFYWEIARELHQRGHNVEVIAGNGENIKYKYLNVKRFKYIPRDKMPKFGNRFKKFGERVSFFINAWPYLKKNEYDYILIHKPLDFFMAYFVKRYNKETKIIFMSGGEDFYGFDKFFSKYIDYIFSVSESNAHKIEKRYKRAVPVIPNGVNVDIFKPMPYEKSLQKEHFDIQDKQVLISVGRIVGWKGFQLVIEALQSLENTIYVVIGEGDYLDNLKKLAKQLGVGKRVLFLGSIEHEALPRYLNMADLFIQPSIGHEAFGITVIEALACNLPVIASYNGGMKEIIRDGKEGLFFEIGNHIDLERSIRKALQMEWGTRPRARVQKYFTWSSSVNLLLKQIL